MLTDSVALVLAYVAYRVSERPGTSRMTYGSDRLKVLVAYTNGLAIFGIAIWIVVEAVARMNTPQPILAGPMLAIAVAGFLVNCAVFAILAGGDRSSINLRGAMLHVAGDLLGSLAATAAALIVLSTGWLAADPLLSILVAVLLVGTAWRLVRDAGMILLEATPPTVDRNQVATDIAQNAEGVLDIHHMHIWTLDGKRMLATLHARLAAGAEAEKSIAAIKTRLSEEHHIHHATVEVESGDACSDEMISATRKRR
jgi:cobalt-zinc-cadmium efflux system protein